ncbi:MAG TPA: CocE/NonD family hydrolase, partial [Vicinamibacterales bacterium]|nr:CocE/NonD family hydrolase [Vicinamibacterales bacterium]
MRKATAPVAALALSAAFAVACAGRPPRSVAHWDEDLLSPQRYRVRIEKDVQVPMRDGVTLATDLYIPEAPGRFPALLWRNCYGKDGYGDMSWYASRGYVVVHQDV